MKTAFETVLRLILACLGGWLVYLGYEPHGKWGLAVVGVALFIGSLAPWNGRRVGAWWGALIGFPLRHLLSFPPSVGGGVRRCDAVCRTVGV